MSMVSPFTVDAATVGGAAAVVGPQYCAPYPVGVAIWRKPFTVAERFDVSDMHDNLLFKVESDPSSFRNKRIISDAAGNVILTIQRKLRTWRDTWEAFRGESSEPNDLVFTAKVYSSLIKPRRKLKAYLAHNVGEEFCDFKLKASYFETSCDVYAGESNATIVAQMQKEVTAGSLLLGKDKFMVTVNPNTDYAFIVALILIFDASANPE